MTAPRGAPEADARPPPSVVQLVMLAAILSVWAIITVGIAFDAAEVTSMYQYLTLFVAVLVSRYWDVPGRFVSGSE